MADEIPRFIKGIIPTEGEYPPQSLIPVSLVLDPETGEIRMARAPLINGEGAQVTITYPHWKIHAQQMYKSDINTVDLQNNPLHVSFRTPNTSARIHVVWLLTSAGAADFSFTSAPTGGVAGGNVLQAYNRDINSANVTAVIATHNGLAGRVTQAATVPTGGIERHHELIGSGKEKIGGESRDINEWILGQNQINSFRMTSGAANIRAQLTLNFYED